MSTGLDMVGDREQRVWIEMSDPEIISLLCDKISHIPKKGNKVAICFAQQGCMEAELVILDQNTATPLVKALIRMDRLGLPNFQFY